MKLFLVLTIFINLIGCSEKVNLDPKSGANGAAGQQGSQGAQGEKGSQGEVGPNGLKGDAGIQGIQGVPGAKGNTGEKGATGSQGPSGPTGPSGAAGKNGLDGENGSNSLVKLTRQSNLSSCDHDSGTVISFGLDENDNGILEGSEILTTSYVCDGYCKNCDDDNDDGCGKSKVYVCHKDCKTKNHTLYLPQSAVQAHLNHGDKLGKCN